MFVIYQITIKIFPSFVLMSPLLLLYGIFLLSLDYNRNLPRAVRMTNLIIIGYQYENFKMPNRSLLNITTLTRSKHHLRYDLYNSLLLHRSFSLSNKNCKSLSVTFFIRWRIGIWPLKPLFMLPGLAWNRILSIKVEF